MFTPWARSVDRIVYTRKYTRYTNTDERNAYQQFGVVEVQERDWHRDRTVRGLPRLPSLCFPPLPPHPPLPPLQAPSCSRLERPAVLKASLPPSCYRAVNKRCHGRHQTRKLGSTQTSIIFFSRD